MRRPYRSPSMRSAPSFDDLFRPMPLLAHLWPGFAGFGLLVLFTFLAQLLAIPAYVSTLRVVTSTVVVAVAGALAFVGFRARQRWKKERAFWHR